MPVSKCDMGSEFKGRVSIVLDDRALTARLRFIPDSSAESGNLGTLKKLLEDENVNYGIEEEAVADAADLFSESEEECLSDVVASGKEPLAGTGDVYNFSPFTYPEKLEKIAGKIRNLGKAPQIFRIMKIKVERDKRVREKGFFKGGREKIVTVEEEVEKKVRVDVSPDVLDLGFFNGGDLICSVQSSSGSPEPGKDVRGNEIPPAQTGEFWPGMNIRKEKNEFFASETGFVRKGGNWLDLVPFVLHSWAVRLSENKADCYLDITAGHKAAPVPSLEEIRQAVEKLSLSGESLKSDKKILEYIRLGCRSEGAQSFCLTRDLDGNYDIEINSLGTEAFLHLQKGSGNGKKLNLKQAWTRVLALGIKGMETERIKGEILEFNRSGSSEVSILLGKGQDPKRGDDREIALDNEYLSEEELEKIRKRLYRQQKSIPSLKEFPADRIEKMAFVKKGSPIFRLGKQSGGTDGRDIYGNVIKGIEGNDPIVRQYENIIVQEGTAISAIDGILDYSCIDSVYYVRIRKHKDARIMVSVSDNKMRASLSVLPPEGSGRPAVEESLRKALEESGVVKGISGKALEQIAVLSEKGELVNDHVVAEGKVPFQGEQSLKFLVDIEPGKKNSVPVEKNEIIARIVSQSESDGAGFNVLGERLFNDDQQNMERDENIITEKEEFGEVLKAGTKGLLCLEDNRIYIKEKQQIRGDVSRTTGNLQFPGTIEIAGSVLSGIYVNAGKDLRIQDVVEAALLSSAGSIWIGKGVKGDRKAVLRSNENISLGFAENTNLMASGNLYFKKALMNCQIKCNGKIVSRSDGTRIIGGMIKTKNGLSAGSIGSERETATYISFGQDYLVEDQINVMSREIEQINDHLVSLEDMMKLAEEKRQQKKLMALRKKKVQYLKVLEKKGVKNFFLKEKFEMHYKSEIRVTGTIFPGVVFESHGRHLEIKEKLASVIILFDSETGKIKTKTLN